MPVIPFEARRVSPGCRETPVLYARVTLGVADTCWYKPVSAGTPSWPPVSWSTAKMKWPRPVPTQVAASSGFLITPDRSDPGSSSWRATLRAAQAAAFRPSKVPLWGLYGSVWLCN